MKHLFTLLTIVILASSFGFVGAQDVDLSEIETCSLVDMVWILDEALPVWDDLSGLLQDVTDDTLAQAQLELIEISVAWYEAVEDAPRCVEVILFQQQISEALHTLYIGLSIAKIPELETTTVGLLEVTAVRVELGTAILNAMTDALEGE